MFARLANMFTPTRFPSVLLVVGNFGATINILHLVPEDGTTERFSLTSPSSTTTFRYNGATEQAREHIGEVTLYVGDGENASSFLRDVERRARESWNDSSSPEQLQTGVTETTERLQDVLRHAALDAIHELEGREPSMNATQTYPVFVVHVNRSRAGRILTEPTSFH